MLFNVAEPCRLFVHVHDDVVVVVVIFVVAVFIWVVVLVVIVHECCGWWFFCSSCRGGLTLLFLFQTRFGRSDAIPLTPLGAIVLGTGCWRQIHMRGLTAGKLDQLHIMKAPHLV